MEHSEFQVTQHKGINPEKESAKLVAQHSIAYSFIQKLAEGKNVLEIGHGDGYGSMCIAQTARQVTAVDLFEENVVAASQKYARPNLKFMQMNATDLKFEDGQFDLVHSFQVIEHIPRDLLSQYVTEIKRVMKDGGSACISTLNLKRNQKPGVPYDKSPHHDKEFTPEEFKAFLSPFFGKTTVYGLYPKAKLRLAERIKKWGIFKFLPESYDPIHQYYQRLSVSDLKWVAKENLDLCIDLMAHCIK